MRIHQLASRRMAAVFVAASSSLAMTRAHASVVDTHWLGASDSWQNALKWSGGVVPNNDAGSTYHAFIHSGSVNSLGTATISIDELNVDAPAQLTGNTPFNIAVAATINGPVSVSRDLHIGAGASLI